MTPSEQEETMLVSEYLEWFKSKMGHVPYTDLPAITEETEINMDWKPDTFRCNPFECIQTCCLKWAVDQGIPLLVQDLLRLQEGGLLDSAYGQFSTPAQIEAYLQNPDQEQLPTYPKLQTENDHCIHYEMQTRQCKIYAHRPSTCRTFPYLVVYDTNTEAFYALHSARCSISPAAIKKEALGKVGLEHSAVALKDLPSYDQEHIRNGLDSLQEQARSLFLMARKPEWIAELGLAQFQQ